MGVRIGWWSLGVCWSVSVIWLGFVVWLMTLLAAGFGWGSWRARPARVSRFC